MHPKDAGMDALKRIKANTVEKRLLKANGDPNFNISFYVLSKTRRSRRRRRCMPAAASTMRCARRQGAKTLPMDALLQGTATD